MSASGKDSTESAPKATEENGLPPSAVVSDAVQHLKKEILDRLANDKEADVNALLERLHNLERFTADRGPGRQDQGLLLSFVAAFVCVAGVAVALNWRVPAVEFDATISATALEISTKSQLLSLGDVIAVSEYVSIRGASSIRSSTPGIQADDPVMPFRIRPGSAAPVEENIVLQFELPRIHPGSRVRMACVDESTVEITFAGPPVDMHILAADGATLSGRGFSKNSEMEVAKFETLQITSTEDFPMVIRMDRNEANLTFLGDINALDFPAEIPSTDISDSFVSAVSGGTIRLRTVRSTIELIRHDELRLSGVRGTALIELSDDCFTLAFQGDATEALVGKGTNHRNIVPTQASYWFEQQRVPFYLTLFGTLWGVIWGGIAWVRKQVL